MALSYSEASLILDEAERLEAENERLREALEDVGTECRFFSPTMRCARHAQREMWCGGCVAWEALHYGESEDT